MTILDEHQSGLSLPELMQKHKQTRAVIKARLAVYGVIPGRGRKRVLIPVKELSSSMSNEALARKHRCSVSTVWKLRKSTGVQKSKPDRGPAVLMYREGATLEDVAAKYDSTASSVARWLRECGEPVRTKGRPLGSGLGTTDPRHPEIMRMFGEGRSLRQIGEFFGMCRERVRQIANMHNATPRLVASRRRRETVMQEKAERKVAEEAWLITISQMWKTGVPLSEINEQIGSSNATNWIAYHRKLRPDLFPYRRPDHWAVKRAKRKS